MCGIVGYVGEKKCTPILIQGLLKLEYRGYDSSGIAVLEENNIKVFKQKGRVSNLIKLTNDSNLSATVGIAHTRWATHGKPSKLNAHPHTDNSKSFAVVHNGIIENYEELKSFLSDEGYKFYTKTDTEIIPNLIHYHYSNSTEKDSELKFLKAVNLACKNLKGSYALEVICKYSPNIEIVVRKASPLVIGKGIGENFVASDIPAILPYTKDFYFLDDNEFAVIKKDSIDFFDKNLSKHEKILKELDLSSSSSDKRGYEDYMLKEIFEQPETIKNTIGSRLKLGEICDFSDLEYSKSFLESINQIYIVACGTAMHAGLVGKNLIEKLCSIPVTVEIASEFRYRDPLINEHTLCIYITQSGETADTIAALKLAKEKGAKTLAISNVIGSSITREAHKTIYTHAGPEIAVASTKAYTSQVVLITLLSIYFSELLERYNSILLENLKAEILELPNKVTKILKDSDYIRDVAQRIYNNKDMFFLGRGNDYNIALEGSLKLKEISYIHSEAYPAGELKHGPIALIEKGTFVVGILTDPNLIAKSISNIQEVITRGAKTLIITNQEITQSDFDFVFSIPNTNPLISPIISIIPLQLLSYYIAKEKDLDVDKPRNLAKSVTVE